MSVTASDDFLGGTNNTGLDKLMLLHDSHFDNLWKYHYKGVYLANTAIEGITSFLGDNPSEAVRQMLGEAYFMRAFYYFDLADMFGELPLIQVDQTGCLGQPRSSAEDVYALIGSDLVKAIDLMSAKPYNQFVAGGHATRWAAEALLGRVFLFYTGFYGKDALPAAKGGQAITKQQAADWINDCVQNSGHDLVGDFRWPLALHQPLYGKRLRLHRRSNRTGRQAAMLGRQFQLRGSVLWSSIVISADTPTQAKKATPTRLCRSSDFRVPTTPNRLSPSAMATAGVPWPATCGTTGPLKSPPTCAARPPYSAARTS